MKIYIVMKSILATIVGILILTHSYAQWIKLPQFPALNYDSHIQFVDKNIGWMNYGNCDKCNVFQTIDGGINWKEVNPYATGTRSESSFLYFKDKNEGIVSRGRDKDYNYVNRRTIDGGQSWQNITMTNFAEPHQPKILSLQFVQGVYLGIVYHNQTIRMAKIKDGSMELLNTVNDYPSALFFCDTLTGYAASVSGFRKTVNGGKTWNAMRTGINATFTKIFFTDKNHGFGINSNLILYTDNGGLSWKDVSWPNNRLVFNDIVFTTPTVGYICGSQGIMLKTIDGGLSWKEMQSGTFENLNAFSFPDSTIGYCVGDNGTILKLIEDPTVPQVVSLTPPAGVLCAGATYQLGYTVNKKFDKSNVFVARLSDAAGEFGNSTAIGTAISDTSGTITITIPSNTPRNFGYRIRIQSSAPSAVSATNENFIEIQPSVQLTINVTMDKGTICQGDVVNFSAMLVNGGNNPQISWYNHSTPIGKGIKFAYKPKDKDLINIYGKSSLACAMPDSIMFGYPVQCVTESPMATIPEAMYIVIKTPTTPTIKAVGNELTSSANKGNQWYKGDEKIPNATAQTYTATQAGQYKVLVNDGACTPEFSATISVIISGTLSSEQLQGTLTLYPNPAGEEVNIESSIGIERIRVYNSNGVKVLETNYVSRLSVSQLSQGLYLLEAVDGNGNSVRSKFEKR